MERDGIILATDLNAQYNKLKTLSSTAHISMSNFSVSKEGIILPNYLNSVTTAINNIERAFSNNCCESDHCQHNCADICQWCQNSCTQCNYACQRDVQCKCEANCDCIGDCDCSGNCDCDCSSSTDYYAPGRFKTTIANYQGTHGGSDFYHDFNGGATVYVGLHDSIIGMVSTSKISSAKAWPSGVSFVEVVNFDASKNITYTVTTPSGCKSAEPYITWDKYGEYPWGITWTYSYNTNAPPLPASGTKLATKYGVNCTFTLKLSNGNNTFHATPENHFTIQFTVP